MAVSKRFLWISLAVFTVLMAVLAFGNIDYNISKDIVNPDSSWAGFFNLFGEQPAFIALYAGIIILHGARKREGRWKNALKITLSSILILVAAFQISFMPVHYLFEHTEESITPGWWIFTIAATFILAGLGLVAAERISTEKLRSVRNIGIVLILLVVSEIVLVNILKILWARPRMRSMDSMDQFRHWYMIGGPTRNNELKSFPSGHTANGFVAIAFSMFFSGVKKVKANLYLAFALVWGILVALSRVVRGDHFLSDVLMSCIITTILFLLIKKIVFKRGV